MPDLKEIREALKKNPDNPSALKGAGKIFLADHQYKQANNYYSQAVSLSSRLLPEIIIDYETVIGKDPTGVGPHLSLVGFYLSQADTGSAVVELEEILETNPQCKEAYNLLGRIYIRREKIDEAIALLEQSIKEGIKDVVLAEILAGAYLEKGRIADAI
ncbi:MAG: tetratricopeptide repeat protein, partial [Candidatus Margulisbacteria bacterium]|nr:tetratricopeptide repeat protein [Candidatus Margulisiibacteriota bacterium]